MKRSRKEVSEKEKKEERLIANRKAARASRKRKKILIEELQRSVLELKKANDALQREYDELNETCKKVRVDHGGDVGQGCVVVPRQTLMAPLCLPPQDVSLVNLVAKLRKTQSTPPPFCNSTQGFPPLASYAEHLSKLQCASNQAEGSQIPPSIFGHLLGRASALADTHASMPPHPSFPIAHAPIDMPREEICNRDR